MKDSTPGSCFCMYLGQLASSEKLKATNDYTAITFHKACKVNHLLDDDSELDNVLSQASHFQMPRELCDLNATIYAANVSQKIHFSCG